MTGIVATFQNEEIFVTGGSGVVGRALIEKLLRSCDVKRIYILLRTKKGVSVNDRLTKFREHKIFEQLCLQKPGELDKVVAVPGDIQSKNLGITTEYAQMMANVSLVYHCAASVRFDEPLETAINMNIGGTLQALTFAETLKKLRLFMHISTYFSNPYLEFVEPKVYPPPMDWRLCLKLAQSEHCDGAIRLLTKKLITGFPNTYCFTKNVTESLVKEYQDRLPVAIFRPSIVIFSLNEPVPGFPPAMMGAMGIFLGVATGTVKTMYMDPLMLDATPQDIMVNALAYYTQHAITLYKTEKQSSVPVYIASTTKYFKHTLAEISQLTYKLNIWRYWGYEKAFLVPYCTFTNNRLLYMTIVFGKQLLPAILGDLLIRLFGHKPAIMGIQRKIFVATHEMRAFVFNKFSSEGFTLEKEIMSDTQGTPFAVSTKDLNVQERNLAAAMLNMTYEMREHLLKENPATIPKFRRIAEMKVAFYDVIRYFVIFYACRKLLSIEYADLFVTVFRDPMSNITI